MRINISGIKQVDTCLDAKIDLPAPTIKVCGAYLAKEAAASKSHRPQAEQRNA